jgi:hypothetical protein
MDFFYHKRRDSQTIWQCKKRGGNPKVQCTAQLGIVNRQVTDATRATRNHHNHVETVFIF